MVDSPRANIWFAVYYSPMTARISPMVCMERIRFFFIDIFKFLLKSRLYWDGAGALSAALW